MSASFECIEVVPNLSLYKYQYSTVKIPSCSEKLTPILKLLCEVFLFYIWFSTAVWWNPIPYWNRLKFHENIQRHPIHQLTSDRRLASQNTSENGYRMGWIRELRWRGQLIVLILVPFSEIQGPDGFISPEMGYPPPTSITYQNTL